MNYFFIIGLLFFSLLQNRVVISKDFKSYLGSKTPYRFLKPDDMNIGQFRECRIRKSWMMMRHGSRFPGETLIKFMQNVLPGLRDNILDHYKNNDGPLNEKQLSSFRTWFPRNISVSKEKYLSFEGEIEMMKLAQRMQKRFKNIIPQIYDNKTFIFKHTPTERTYESCKHFAIGLFGEEVANKIKFTVTAPNDSVLRFYKGCKAWELNVKKNRRTYEEQILYVTGEEMETAMKNISTALGFDYPMNYNFAKSLYQTCAFEQSLWTEDYVSPWCFLFNVDSIQVLEYAADLKNYWLHGYGFPITRKLPCNVLQDVLRFFEEEGNHKSAFHFTHSGTIVKTLAYLGLYNTDGALKHNSRDPNRSWRTSHIDVFGSNIEFILYDCNGVEKIIVMHQEEPVLLPECKDYFCPINIIKKAREKSLNDCDIKKMCEISHDEL